MTTQGTVRAAVRRAVEFAFEDAKQMGSFPAHPHIGMPYWQFDDFVDSFLKALAAEHPAVRIEVEPNVEGTTDE